jgi:hypothetical protein
VNVNAPRYSNNFEKLVFDIETAPVIGLENFIEGGEPPKNYKNADAIERWKTAALESEGKEAALDPDLCRIVALSYASDQDHEPETWLATTEQEEKTLLERWWSRLRDGGTTSIRHTVGFNILEFDWPIVLRRCLYLDVKNPGVSIDRFRHPSVTDLKRMLDFNGLFRFQKGRTLSFYLKRFGIPSDDAFTGAQIPDLVAQGKWDAVKSHVEADVRGELALAERIGAIEAPVIF